MQFSDVPHVVGVLANVATAAGVFFLWEQMKQAREQATTSFEDDLSREYRDLARRIPVEALLDLPLGEKELETHLPAFLHYIDLSNEQVFLRQQDRVRPDTWRNWCDGIESNLKRRAFQEAWLRIKKAAPQSFEELRRLEASDFKEDPIKNRLPNTVGK